MTSGLTKISVATMITCLGSAATPAFAFFNQTDRTEIRSVLPNETAFWIEDTDNNDKAQSQTNSVAALEANRVYLRRVQIDHYKLSGSNGKSLLSGWDYYVPKGRLIVVDRTIFSREWVKDENRGTSKEDDSIHCQDKTGLNIKVGVSVGASIAPEDAAKYLYKFGVIPPEGDPENGEVIFTSVYNSRKLVSVMDDVGRKRIQTLICRETSSRTLDEANRDANAMIDKVAEETKQFFAPYGITIDFIGWGDTFTFDPAIQDAINRVYVADKDAEVAKKLSPWISALQGQAEAETIRKFGEKTDGKLPTTMVGTQASLPTIIKSLLGTYINDAITPTAPDGSPAAPPEPTKH